MTLSSLAKDLVRKDDEGKTVAELAKETGMSKDRIQKELRKRIAANRVVIGQRESIDNRGRPCHVPVYKLIDLTVKD